MEDKMDPSMTKLQSSFGTIQSEMGKMRSTMGGLAGREDVGCAFPSLDDDQLRQIQLRDPDLAANGGNCSCSPPAAATSALKSPKKKRTAPKAKKVGLSVSELILKALASSKERNGVSLPALKKSLAAGGYDVEKNNARVKFAIKKLVAKDAVAQVKGSGASGSFKLNKKEKAAAKAKPKSSTAKPAAKKPAAAKKVKKPAAAKKATPKKSHKKAKKSAAAKSPKKVKSAVKPKKAAKSPARPKAVKPKVAKPQTIKAKAAKPKVAKLKKAVAKPKKAALKK
ncbi:uncharacterized protein LOC142929599 [Petromyzon marinus]|uniref:uncharacterized protein LOC142929599 n=1 Tax=Petromyzon marinus TaxID=7757 RepID=UPI003F71D1E3